MPSINFTTGPDGTLASLDLATVRAVIVTETETDTVAELYGEDESAPELIITGDPAKALVAALRKRTEPTNAD